nr:hypothetical protein [Trinickia terrae]
MGGPTAFAGMVSTVVEGLIGNRASSRRARRRRAARRPRHGERDARGAHRL